MTTEWLESAVEPVVARLGESMSLALTGVIVGMAFGFMAQRSRFCQRSAVIEFARNLTDGKLTVWLLAFATAVLATQTLAGLVFGLVFAVAAQAGAAGIGLSAAAAWWATYLIANVSFNPHPVQSLSFTGPSADVLSRVLFASDKPATFDLGLVPGVFLGAFLAAAATDRRLDHHPSGPLDQPIPAAGPVLRALHLARRSLPAMLAGCAFVGAQAGATPLRAEQVADRVWFTQGDAALGSPANRNFISNAGFIVTDDGVVVVDALGSPALAEELLAEIRRVTSQPVRYVIVTHYHADHIYGLQAFKAAGATILAHAEGREYLNSDTAQKRLEASRKELGPWVDGKTQLVPADRWLDQDETRLRVGSYDILIRHVGPAHTPEDLVVFVPKLGVLFSGDLFFRGRIPFVGQADSRLWIASLERLIDYKPRLVIPGHGPASLDPMTDLLMTRDYLTYLRQTMGVAAHNMEPFEEAYERADWSRYEKMPLFRAANRMNAYNTYLLMEQQDSQ